MLLIDTNVLRVAALSDVVQPHSTIFTGTVRARSKAGLLCLVLVSAMFALILFYPELFAFLPYSVPISGLLVWNILCLLGDFRWSVSVSPRFITWDRLFGG